MSARSALRAATRDAHDRVDALFSGFDLADGEGYRRFLAATWAGFAPVEAAIDRAGGGEALEDWPRRRRADLLAADARETGAEMRAAGASPRLVGPAEALGAIYVLEGSRMGGAVLRRSVPPGWPARFLNAPAEPGAWSRLMATLDRALAAPQDLRAAVVGAKAAFACFEAAGQEGRGCVERV